MKNVLYLVLFFNVLCLMSCSNDKKAAEITLSETEIVVDCKGGVKTINLNSVLSWKAVASQSFVSVTPSSGVGGDAFLIVEIAENTDRGSREAEIVVKSEDVIKKIHILQAQKDALVIAPSDVTIDSAGGEISFQIGRNVDYEVVTDSYWIKRVDTRAWHEENIKFSVAANESVDSRTGTIVFKYGDIKQEVKIFQNQKNVMNITPESATVEASGGVISFTVGYNVEFKAFSECDWIRRRVSRTYTDDKLFFEVDVNRSVSERTGFVLFKSDDLEQRVSIVQRGEDAVVDAEKSFYEIEANGGELLINVTHNVDIRPSISEDWIFLKHQEHGRLTFNVIPNEDIHDRECSISLESDECVPCIIVIKQYGKPLSPVEFEWVELKAGTFMMGGSDDEGWDWDQPVHKVILTKDFKMSKYEVTFDQYDEFCEKTGRAKPDDEGWGRKNRPVIHVSWNDAVAFCEWAGVRLPTEAEWEYACRAGSTSKYFWGDTFMSEYCWYNGNSNTQSHPVGLKKPNAWGLYDMVGNVYEWCADYHDDYNEGDQIDPRGPSTGSDRVMRGGSWGDVPFGCRSAYRFHDAPSSEWFNVGFRVCIKD